MTTTLLQAAEYWLALECALLPCQPKSKALVGGFGPYRKHVNSLAEAGRWFGKRACNLAVVCGVGGLAVADFDDLAAFNAWRAGPGAGVETRIERTPRGAHVFFRTLATLPAVAQSAGIEIKSRGAVLVAPSAHPTGKHYQVQSGVDPLWIDRPARLFPLLSSTRNPSKRQTETSRRPSAALPGAADLLSRIKAAAPVAELAGRLTLLKSSSADGRYLLGHCPFHDDKRPSFWVDTEMGLWGCYSPHCPTRRDGHTAHDVINLVARSENVSEAEAIRRLAARLGLQGGRHV